MILYWIAKHYFCEVTKKKLWKRKDYEPIHGVFLEVLFIEKNDFRTTLDEYQRIIGNNYNSDN